MQNFSLLISLLFCLLVGSVAYAENPRVEPVELDKEHQVKAAMLYKITWFVRWETKDFIDEKSAINLCLLEPEPFGTFLEQIVEGRFFGKYERPIAIKRIDHIDDHDSLVGCHVLFIPKDSHVQSNYSFPSRSGLLVVTEDQPVATSQAHINFVTNNEHVTFEVNMNNLKESQIKLSSKLLKLAQIVRN